VLTRANSAAEYDLIVQLFIRHIKKLSFSQSLIIIDNYFVSISGKDKFKYFETIEIIMKPIIANLAEITIICKKAESNQAVFNEVQNILKALNSSVHISMKHSANFHDRFWIFDKREGLFVGTSLNGIGKKYALLDKMKNIDVLEIVDILHSEGLIR